jgi:uncharacterized membrane protein
MIGQAIKVFCVLGFVLVLHGVAYAEWNPSNDIMSTNDENAEATLDGIMVTAQKSGESILVDVSLTVKASAEEVWTVLTDFDHMAQFVSNVRSSKIVNRSAEGCRVWQVGRAGDGPLSFAFDSIQEFELKPFEEIRSRLISGSMKKLDGVTQLISLGNETTIVYHGVSIPNVWVPPLIGTSFIRTEVHNQYRDISNEITRRKRLKAN